MLNINDYENLDRLKMEVKGINITDTELEIYLLENDLTANEKYDPADKTKLKNIYKTALSILESIANDTSMMKDYKTEDITISNFYENLLARIDDLRKKINQMNSEEFQAENEVKIVPFIF